MKKLILFCLVVTMISCKKNENCNCGVITKDGIDGSCYFLTIKNDCSGNTKTFCFDHDVWFNNHVGDNFCVTNEDEW